MNFTSYQIFLADSSVSSDFLTNQMTSSHRIVLKEFLHLIFIPKELIFRLLCDRFFQKCFWLASFLQIAFLLKLFLNILHEQLRVLVFHLWGVTFWIQEFFLLPSFGGSSSLWKPSCPSGKFTMCSMIFQRQLLCHALNTVPHYRLFQVLINEILYSILLLLNNFWKIILWKVVFILWRGFL